MMSLLLLSRKVRQILFEPRSDTNQLVANGKESKGPPKTNGEKKADQIANGLEAMRVDDSPRATSKNLDVLKEYANTKSKNAANFVVIGMVQF
jgi:elongation factor 1 alpha-like protein